MIKQQSTIQVADDNLKTHSAGIQQEQLTKKKARPAGLALERKTGIEPATFSLGN